MSVPASVVSAKPAPRFAELFTPKLVTVLREGYRLADLRADAQAGLTVAIVALPLSMAIAIASGTTPDRGLYTSIVGGFLISLLGGSRFQVGGPAGAFIVVVATSVAHLGYENFAAAVVLAGVMLMALGLLRLGTVIKFIPYPVTIGFSAGIGVTIFASQIRDFLGLTLHGAEPAAFLPKLAVLWGALPTISSEATAITIVSVALIALVKRLRPHWPAYLIAIFVAALAVAFLHLPVETIGTRFGGIPRTLPSPAMPPLSLARLPALLPDAFTFALLGSIESLLSATVADGMTGRRHRSNCELVAQGIASIASALFGGLSVTGVVARTCTNVRAGAHGPLSGIFHSLFLLLFMLAAAPLARFIPLSALAAVLAVVAWDMIDRRAFATMIGSSWGDTLVLLATFGLTVFKSLTLGILVGFGIGTLLFLYRMAQTTGVEPHFALVPEDKPDDAGAARTPYDAAAATDPDISVYRISGALFFGAAAAVATLLDQLAERPRTLVLDFAAVPFLDSTGANMIASFARKAARGGVTFIVTGTSPAIRAALKAYDVKPPAVRFEPSIEAALRAPKPAG